MADKVPPLVDPFWLSRQISASEGSAPLCIIDVTWNPHGRPGQDYHQESHIPGSFYFDLEECRNKESPYRVTMPTAEQFGRYVSGLGIGNHTHVVVYECDPTYAAKTAERAWWMFRVFGHDRVSVLDGGLDRWVKEGHPTMTQKSTTVPAEPRVAMLDAQYQDKVSVLDKGLDQAVNESTVTVGPREARFEAKFRKELVRSYQEVLEDLRNGTGQLLDTRPPHWFDGSRPSLWPNLQLGTIVGSSHLPFNQLLHIDSATFKSPQQIREVFDSRSVDLSRPLTTTCNVGVTACIVAMAAFILGKEDVPVFDGSWDEFSQRAPPEMLNINHHFEST